MYDVDSFFGPSPSCEGHTAMISFAEAPNQAQLEVAHAVYQLPRCCGTPRFSGVGIHIPNSS